MNTAVAGAGSTGLDAVIGVMIKLIQPVLFIR
jgi:hypothetical protein